MSRKVFRFHMAIGVDLIGSKTSMQASKTVDLWETDRGIEMYSKTSNRTLVIPYSNVKGYELFPEVKQAEEEAKAAPKRVNKQATALNS